MNSNAESEEHPVKVGVTLFDPLVVKDAEGHFGGFELELWQKVADELSLSYEYVEHPFPALLPAVANGDVAVAIAGITRTSEREHTLDFSHRTLDSGLHILVPNKTSFSIFSTLKSMASKDIMHIFWTLMAFVLASSHLLWFAERGSDAIDDRYVPGIFESIWWAIVTVSTVGYGDFSPASWAGRIVGVVVILLGLVIFGMFIGQVSSTITLDKLKTGIAGPEDLRKKRVATKKGTSAVSTLTELDAHVIESDTIEEAYALLAKERVDAVVFDAPVLQNYVTTSGSGRFNITGPLFHKETYGFAFPEGSELKEQVNRVLLKLRESGVYDELHAKWFGTN